MQKGMVLILTGMVLACDDAETERGFHTETLPSGIRNATNSGSGSWSSLDRWQAILGLRLGRTEGEGPDLFGSISAIEADTDGRIYVFDRQAQEVRIFDSGGSHLRTFGRRGEGPGEFGGGGGLNLDPQGNLWVADPNNRRFTKFDPSGEILQTVGRTATGIISPWRGEIVESDRLADWSLEFPEDQPGPSIGSVTQYTPILVDLSDGTVDTLPPLIYHAATEYENRAPFRRSLYFHVSESGQLWVAETDRYRLACMTLQGDTMLVVSRVDAEAALVTPEERDSILAIPDPLAGFPGREPLKPEWIPTQKPVLSRFTTNDKGNLFVFPRLANHPAGTVADVFQTATGEYLGQIGLPVRLSMNPPPIAVGNALIGVTTDELDVQFVVRLDLVPERR